MVFDIMERYGIHEQAELFEADENAFDARVRSGYYRINSGIQKPD